MLTNLLALFGLVSVPALLAVYLLRNRVKRLEVSSLMLWADRSRTVKGGGRLQRNPLPLLFFLELLILLLLVFAAANPQILSPNATRPLTVILDNSASMGAIGTDGLTAADRALEGLPRLIRNGRFGPVRFILAGHDSRWLDGEAGQALLQGRRPASWILHTASFNLEKAMLLARTEGNPLKKILVISDRRPDLAPIGGELRWLAAGQSLLNAGFINAVRSDDRCMVEIRGDGNTSLTLTTGAGTRTVPIELRPGESRRMVFTMDNPSARFTAELPADALSIDNKVILLPDPEQRVRTELRIQNPDLLELMQRTLDASGMQDETEGAAELIVTDIPSATASPDAWELRILPAPDAVPFTGPFIMDYHSPLLDGVSFEGLVWAASRETVQPGMPIVAAGNVPLLTRLDALSGRAQFHLQIDPAISTLQQSPAWPVLVWNLMGMRADLKPGFREVNLRPGMTLDFIGADAPLEEPAFPGLIEAEVNGTLHEAAYNFLDSEESNLSGCGRGDDGSWLDTDTLERQYVKLAPLVILAVLALLALHQLLLRREEAMTA